MSPHLSHLSAVWVVTAPSSLFNQIDNTFLLELLSGEMGLSLIQVLCSTHYTLGTGIMIKEQFLCQGLLKELQDGNLMLFSSHTQFLSSSFFILASEQSRSMPEKMRIRQKVSWILLNPFISNSPPFSNMYSPFLQLC